MVYMKKAQTLKRLREATERLLSLCGSESEAVAGTDSLIAINARLVLCAAYQCCPEAILDEMKKSGIKPEDFKKLMEAFGFQQMERNDAIAILKLVADGDLVETHPSAITAFHSLGKEANSIFAQLERDHREKAAAQDFMRRTRRVTGCAFAGKNQR